MFFLIHPLIISASNSSFKRLLILRVLQVFQVFLSTALFSPVFQSKLVFNVLSKVTRDLPLYLLLSSEDNFKTFFACLSSGIHNMFICETQLPFCYNVLNHCIFARSWTSSFIRSIGDIVRILLKCSCRWSCSCRCSLCS